MILLVGSAAPLGSADGQVEIRVLSARAVTVVSRSTLHPPNPSTGPIGIRLPGGTVLEPARTGFDRQVTGFTAAGAPVVEHRSHILLGQPMPPGAPVRLDLPTGPVEVVFLQDRVTSAIQVNQVGYTTHGPKFAYVGEWLGTAGPMPVDAKQFRLEDSSGRVVFVGALSPRGPADAWSGNDVYEADFTDFTTPGQYRLTVPRVGRSYEFSISPDVYDDVYRTVARLMYHSRNGMPISRPFADPGYERPGGIPAAMDGVLHPRVNGSPLGSGSGSSHARRIRRGWFDAGDYGQYMTNAAPVWYAIGAALDLAPDNFRDGDLDIPESGNGIPDVLDELEWGMDWALTMQDEDGGVFWRIASRTWDGVPPHDVDQPRLIAERTTHATAVFAAAAAIHSRLIRPYRPARADAVLDAARRAWRFATSRPRWPAEGDVFRNPEGVHAGEYPDESATDALAWAAAELFRETGEREFVAAFESLFRLLHLDPTAPVSFRDQGMAAAWAYLLCDSPVRDASQLRRARDAVMAGADWRLRQMASHPFRAPQHPGIELTGWGSFAHSTRGTLPLLQAYRLSGDDRYRRAAWTTPGPQLGANPQSMSYITGLGANRPRNPLSKLSQYDKTVEPLRGIPVNGPHYHLPRLWRSTRAVMQGYYPVADGSPGRPAMDYPALRRYTDSELLPPMGEPTIAEIAMTAVSYGLLRDEERAFGAPRRAAAAAAARPPQL